MLPDKIDPHVLITVNYVDILIEEIKVPLQAGEQYVPFQQAAFMNGLLIADGWFTVQDIDGVFWAIRTDQIQTMTFELATNE